MLLQTKAAIAILLLTGLTTACRPVPAPAPTPTAAPTALPAASATPPVPGRLQEWADLGAGKGPVYSQAWSPDGRLLATADYNQVRLWDASARQEIGLLEGHYGFIWGLAWAPVARDADPARAVLASASQDGTVILWDTASRTPQSVLETGWAFCLAWSPDGTQLAVGNAAGDLQVWDALTGAQLHSWYAPEGAYIISAAWSPDGRTIAAGELDGGLFLWEVASGKIRKAITGYTQERSDVNGLAWSPDGSLLASAHQDGFLRLWDGGTGEMVRQIKAHNGWARGLAWRPDGSLLASGGEDKRICLWDPHSGQLYASQRHNYLPVWSAAWSPDGEKVSSGAGEYRTAHTGATIIWTLPR